MKHKEKTTVYVGSFKIREFDRPKEAHEMADDLKKLGLDKVYVMRELIKVK